MTWQKSRNRMEKAPFLLTAMDAASCSILRAQPFSSTSAVFPPSNNPTARFFAFPKNNPNLVPSFSSTFPRNSTFPGNWLHFDRFADFSSLSGAQDQNPSQELAVLLEVDGSVVGKLGEERISKLKIVRDKEVEQSLYTQLVNDTGLSSGMDEQLAKEAIKAVSAEKQTIAEEVASIC